MGDWTGCPRIYQELTVGRLGLEVYELNLYTHTLPHTDAGYEDTGENQVNHTGARLELISCPTMTH